MANLVPDYWSSPDLRGFTPPSTLAGLLIMRGDGTAARDLLLRCCGIAPHRADAWDTLGLAFLSTGDAPLAESAFARAQELAPLVLEYALHRVEAACANGTEESLLAWLDVATEADPLSPVLPTARGALLERLGRRAEAVDALEAATALAPAAAARRPVPVRWRGAPGPRLPPAIPGMSWRWQDCTAPAPARHGVRSTRAARRALRRGDACGTAP